MTLALASTAQASAVRTFVSGTGTDANTSTNCARPTPCRTFAAAYTVTSAGGTIVALDAAGYGPLTITTALTVVGIDGAGLAPAANTTGISINAGSHLVIIRNLEINGANAANSTGISLIAGHLILENSTLKQLTTGLIVNNSKAQLNNVEIAGNGTGIATFGTGVDLNTFPQTGTTWVVMHYGTVLNNTTAFVMNDPGNNKNTILATQLGSALSIWAAGNTNFMTGSGSSCVSACNSLFGILQQNGQNLL